MSDSKELLEATIKGLQEKVDSLAEDLNAKKTELADANKPVMTQSTLDLIESVVGEVCGNVLSDLDADNFEYEFELSGNEIGLYSLQFSDADSVAEDIMSEIDSNFKIVDDEDED